MAKYTGTGVVASTDFKDVKWVGKTKGGNAVTIKLKDAVNMGNIDWTFAEKDDVVEQIVFTATYSNTDAASATAAEPWEVEVGGSTPTGAAEIMLGAGVFYIGDTAVGLTRGGGSFSVEREYRQINADGDRGPVKGRIVMDGSVATLTMNLLTVLSSFTSLHAGVTTTTA